jgi:hypothetical protein
MRNNRFLPRALGVAALLVLAGGFSRSQQSTDYGPAKVAYDDYIRRPSLQMRTRGRIGLASTGHPGAFDILSKSYAKPEVPRDHVRYLLTSISAFNFQEDQFTDGWQKWRESYRTAGDAWLWYRSLIIHQDNRGEAHLLEVADNDKLDLFIRAAALQALAYNGSDKVLAWWETKLDEADKWKGIERTVMLECAAHNYLKQSYQLGTDQFRNTGLKLIPLIDDKETDPRTSLVMARCFRQIFNTDKLWVNAKPWLNRLLNPDKPAAVADDKYAKQPPPTKFVGIEANGKRIVYVIDMSDSMCKPFTVKEKEEIKKPPEKPKRRGPITGEGDKGKDKEGEKPPEPEPEKEKDLEDEMPWDKIKTRWDCAREYLKLSLRALQEDQYYCVIWFGSEAGPLRTTRAMIPAHARHIEATIRELDAVKKGAPTADRKDGTMRGNTNLHGGIHRAFKVFEKGLVKEYEYVDPSTFFTGADTIFVLSDGDPTWDDWPVNDKRDDFDQTGDPESRTRHADMDVLMFPGPYGYMYENPYLADDVRRLNLFRRCEIHCIGIGEATYNLMYQIAEQGNGQIKMVGGGGD